VAQKTAQSDNLSLRAVIPGRAWLVDTQGRTYTVTQGDLVGNFGKVVQIDADAGRVITSSGYVFN
jgi:intracellular multiplication protein IcmG